MLTSHFEGFARVIMEAALAGVPVVTTKVSGISGIVTHDVSGFVLEQGDEARFIEAVKRLITDQNKRIMTGRAIRETAREKLSTAMMLEKQKQIHDYLASLNTK
jgi:glycosyltransferase involved in cell wall biosynthesis